MFIVTLAVLVYCFNNQTTTLQNSSNTTDNALLQRLCLSVLVPAPLNLLGLTLQIIAVMKTLGAITPKDHSIAPANQGTMEMDTIVQVK